MLIVNESDEPPLIDVIPEFTNIPFAYNIVC